MRVLVISNDVIPGFGVPVAAPGIRAAGLAEGLRDHAHDVTVLVPADLLATLFGQALPDPPTGVIIAQPPAIHNIIVDGNYEVVVFINANLTPHLRPIPGVHFVYDLFAPKLLESLASTGATRPWQEGSSVKSRAMALADSVWVNGHRKLGYGLGWLVRPDVDAIRTREFGLPSIVDASVADRLSVVEMPVPLPNGLSSTAPAREGPGIRLGIAGYAQAWSSLPAVHPGHQLLVDHGFELHALLPGHWGGTPSSTPSNALPARTVHHHGPMVFEEFARWVQGMDAMVDVFAATAERRFAMITRSAVALRLGVPLIHAVDSEISDIVQQHDAGWVMNPNDMDAWERVSRESSDPTILQRKRIGAMEASTKRFAPKAALTHAADALKTASERS